jgi:hypothetical protein
MTAVIGVCNRRTLSSPPHTSLIVYVAWAEECKHADFHLEGQSVDVESLRDLARILADISSTACCQDPGLCDSNVGVH